MMCVIHLFACALRSRCCDRRETLMWLQNGDTALLLACKGGHLDVARWLVAEAGSDPRSEIDEVLRLWRCCMMSRMLTVVARVC
jgi:hypothetical protein